MTTGITASEIKGKGIGQSMTAEVRLAMIRAQMPPKPEGQTEYQSQQYRHLDEVLQICQELKDQETTVRRLKRQLRFLPTQVKELQQKCQRLQTELEAVRNRHRHIKKSNQRILAEFSAYRREYPPHS